MKKVIIVFLLLLLVFLPAASAEADSTMRINGFKRWGRDQGRYLSFEGRMIDVKDVFQAKVRYDDKKTVLTVKSGVTWWDQEELLFTEMSQLHARENADYRWKSPDMYMVMSGTVAGYKGEEYLGVGMIYRGMTHGYEGRQRK